MPTRRQIAAAERRISRERFLRARVAEREFSRILARLGTNIGNIAQGFIDKGRVTNQAGLNLAMERYTFLIHPWAESVAQRMQDQVATRDLSAWRSLSRAVGSNLAKEIERAPIANVMRALRDEQVHLITSLPTEAALRVHRLTQEGLISGTRAREVAAEIMRTSEVSKNSAVRIARTETSRTASVLTQTRAEHVGSEGYLWHTSEDSDVRPEHKKLDGRFFKWSAPPVAGTGKGGVEIHAHPGCIWFCRCWAEPVLNL